MLTKSCPYLVVLSVTKTWMRSEMQWNRKNMLDNALKAGLDKIYQPLATSYIGYPLKVPCLVWNVSLFSY